MGDRRSCFLPSFPDRTGEAASCVADSDLVGVRSKRFPTVRRGDGVA